MINCLCCYVIKSAGETAKKVLLSVIWNLLLIEVYISQIRISDSKREKVCAVYPYPLLFSRSSILLSVNWGETMVSGFLYRTRWFIRRWRDSISLKQCLNASKSSGGTNLPKTFSTDHVTIWSESMLSRYPGSCSLSFACLWCMSSSVFCPRAGPSMQTQALRLQFFPKAGHPLQTQEPRLKFY